MSMVDLITTREVAARLGVSPRRVRALYKNRADFPQPVELVPGRLYWTPSEIDEWLTTADRSPHRPRTEVQP